MKVLVTGATGFIGSAVVERLVVRGHQVQGLARSEAAAEKVRKLGAEPVAGKLADAVHIGTHAAASDGMIHAGSITDMTNFDPYAAFAADERMVAAVMKAFHGSGRPFITTSGSSAQAILNPGYGDPVVYTEETPFIPLDFMRRRVDMELTMIGAMTYGIRSMVVRPPFVYGRSGCYAIQRIFDSVRQHRVAPYVGAGENIWSMVHVSDLAELYVLALEKGPAGTVFNSVTSEWTMREAVNVIAKHLGVSAASWSFEHASAEWGEIPARVMSASHRSSSERARSRLGWKPRMPSVADEMVHWKF